MNFIFILKKEYVKKTKKISNIAKKLKTNMASIRGQTSPANANR